MRAHAHASTMSAIDLLATGLASPRGADRETADPEAPADPAPEEPSSATGPDPAQGPLRLGPEARIDGDLQTDRPVVLGERAVVAGDLQTTASVTLGEGVEVKGSTTVEGSLQLGPEARTGPISVASGVRADPTTDDQAPRTEAESDP